MFIRNTRTQLRWKSIRTSSPTNLESTGIRGASKDTPQDITQSESSVGEKNTLQTVFPKNTGYVNFCYNQRWVKLL